MSISDQTRCSHKAYDGVKFRMTFLHPLSSLLSLSPIAAVGVCELFCASGSLGDTGSDRLLQTAEGTSCIELIEPTPSFRPSPEGSIFYGRQGE